MSSVPPSFPSEMIGEAVERDRRIEAPCGRARLRTLDELLERHLGDGFDDRVRQKRELRRHLLDAREPHEVARADAKHLAAKIALRAVDAPAPVAERLDLPRELEEVRAVRLRALERALLHEPRQVARVPHQDVGEKIAAREDRDDEPRDRPREKERMEKSRRRDPRLDEAGEIEERHVGIARSGELGQQVRDVLRGRRVRASGGDEPLPERGRLRGIREPELREEGLELPRVGPFGKGPPRVSFVFRAHELSLERRFRFLYPFSAPIIPECGAGIEEKR